MNLTSRLILLLALVAAISLRAEDAVLADARKALADGLPSVALYRLQQAAAQPVTPEDKLSADLLMAQTLNVLGRYQESIDLLKDQASSSEAQIDLARAYAALGQNEPALALYEKLVTVPDFADEAAIGRSAMLERLGQGSEAQKLLTEFAGQKAPSAPVALALAQIRFDAGQPKEALAILTAIKNPPASLQVACHFFMARALLRLGNTAKAGELLQAIQTPPAALAAEVITTRATYLIETKDLSGAEKILEKYIDENYRLPGLEAVFAKLDEVYSLQGVASGSELRGWAGDKVDPARMMLAAFYLARNEARSSKIDHSRELFQDFLQKYPTSDLADRARTGLAASFLGTGNVAEALNALQGAPADGEAGFLRGLALAAQQKYDEAAADFTKAAETPALRDAALFNAAVCAALADKPDVDNAALQQIMASDPTGERQQNIRLTEALFFASQHRPEAGKLLSELAKLNNETGREAQLALTEWDFLKSDPAQARQDFRLISTDDPADRERKAYLAVFLADTGTQDSEPQAMSQAQDFLKAYPDSQFAPDVRMKLAEILFRRGDYLGARSQFNQVAEDSPGSPLAANATFLGAQSMARSMDPQAMEAAIDIYEDIAKSGGPLAYRARLAEANLFNTLNRPKEGLGVLDSILAGPVEPELRYMTLIEKGDTLFSEGATNPDFYKQAIAVWQTVSSDPAALSSWRNQALDKMGAAYEKLGDSNAALNCYYSVFSAGQKGEPEYFWFYKAGFEAGHLLETQKLWNEAIAVYEKIGSFEGPRAEEARNRVNTLRLENFLWEN